MILYFRRTRDGAIITRELAEADGVRVRLSPPADAELIDPVEAEAELAELAAARERRRLADRSAAAVVRLQDYEALIGLGLPIVTAARLSGHRRVVDLGPPAAAEGEGGGDGR